LNNQQPPHRKLKGEFADYFLLLSNQPIILQATHLKPQLFPQKLIQKIKQFPVKKDTIIKQLNYPPMKTDKVEFENRDGDNLSARIELPAEGEPESFALFAHCFTCTKNLSAVRNIGRALTAEGFGVLRFDFTGLGESEGDFADTNFSSNIQDLIAAAKFLSEKYKAPSILIGHSLGGAAVLHAGIQIDSVSAIATIGAPADPGHVKKLVTSGLDDIKTKGYADVSIGGRPFTIKKQFLDDLEETEMDTVLKKMRKALLIAHSPQDNIVGINNAAEIFTSARHPKSFISLDGADHLLSKAEDSTYVGKVIASWAARYLT